MKTAFRKILLVVQCMFMPVLIAGVFADPPGPPGPGGPPGSGGGIPVGGPVGDGISVLIVLGIAYACYKIYSVRRKKSLKDNTDELLFRITKRKIRSINRNIKN
jgi:hypothetical protein